MLKPLITMACLVSVRTRVRVRVRFRVRARVRVRARARVRARGDMGEMAMACRVNSSALAARGAPSYTMPG